MNQKQLTSTIERLQFIIPRMRKASRMLVVSSRAMDWAEEFDGLKSDIREAGYDWGFISQKLGVGDDTEGCDLIA